MKRILIINSVHPCVLERVNRSSKANCCYRPDISEEEFMDTISEYEAIMLSSKFRITKDVIDRAKKLEVIGRIGSGVENIDTCYAESKGIIWHNVPEGNRDAVGEQAVGMLLMLQNNLFRANMEIKKGVWRREENRGFEIKGKTVGIIGYGNMGNAFAQRLMGFQANVIAYDKYKINYGNVFAKEVEKETIFKEADILSIHTPLTTETLYMVNSEFFTNFAKPIIFINTARGKIVDTSALVNQMQIGKVSGVCLDVLEYESHIFRTDFKKNMPAPMQYLIQSDRAVLSPHIAGWTVESKKKLCDFLTVKVLHSL